MISALDKMLIKQRKEHVIMVSGILLEWGFFMNRAKRESAST